MNSDTQGTLTVEGRSTASNVIAIIFAPGAAVGGQVRDAAVSNVAGNYLEAPNPYVADAFLAWTGCEASACALPFSGGVPVTMPYNDQFILVTHEDLFRVVEAVVQRRIEQEVAPRLTNPSGTARGPGYFEQWGTDVYGDARRGFFPFAAPYSDPLATPDTEPSRTQDQYRGRLPRSPACCRCRRTPRTGSSGRISPWPRSNASEHGDHRQRRRPDLRTGLRASPTPARAPAIPRTTVSTSRSRRGCATPRAHSCSRPASIRQPGLGGRCSCAFALSVAPRSFDPATGDLLITLNIKLPPTADAVNARDGHAPDVRSSAR